MHEDQHHWVVCVWAVVSVVFPLQPRVMVVPLVCVSERKWSGQTFSPTFWVKTHALLNWGWLFSPCVPSCHLLRVHLSLCLNLSFLQGHQICGGCMFESALSVTGKAWQTPDSCPLCCPATGCPLPKTAGQTEAVVVEVTWRQSQKSLN